MCSVSGAGGGGLILLPLSPEASVLGVVLG